jgi:hypothetical protein
MPKPDPTFYFGHFQAIVTLRDDFNLMQLPVLLVFSCFYESFSLQDFPVLRLLCLASLSTARFLGISQKKEYQVSI